MIHLKNTSNLDRHMANEVLRKSRDFASDLDLIIRDCRISKKFVELDTTVSQSNLDELVEKLSQIGPLDHAKQVVEEIFEKNEAISKGISYFNNERFWECHEVLEGVWKKCINGQEKLLVQGLILVAAGLVHYQKDDDQVCISIFQRAMEKLKNSNGDYNGIDIERIKKMVIEMISSKNINTFTI